MNKSVEKNIKLILKNSSGGLYYALKQETPKLRLLDSREDYENIYFTQMSFSYDRNNGEILFFSNQKSDLHPCKSPFSPREIAAKRRFFAGAQIPRYWILRYYYITIFAIRQSNLRKFLTKNLTKIVPIFQSIFFHYFFEPVRVIKNPV